MNISCVLLLLLLCAATRNANLPFEFSHLLASVAHRLDTIIENDYVIVLGGGKVIEYGAPRDLIEQNGHFASMVAEMSKELRRRAKRS